MRKLFLCAASIAALAIAPARAADDPFATLFGNTLEVTGENFMAHVHYRADHTVDSSGTELGKPYKVKGTWKLDAQGRLCRTYDNPPPTVSNPLCMEPVAHKVGDSWTIKTPKGHTRQLKLVSGIQ